ncbi:SDR family NAD(P)-dependent oxidoreductase [Zavarzinia aquatilis]|uniref:Oxidoreductase n=1 Tax=Zavarzinia aquatilis TaxID=2211142 RepID=A0A317DXA5_9PROT|nr:SDR family NAD(P)-dependent oxidoreductase [Zavarzinia aquatilis]PWR18560.1 oxidoreductase [Zavarzinia aquatilis]
MTAPFVWITGASSGIGFALAEEFVRQGWRVAASARGAQGLAQPPAGTITLPLDVTDEAAVAGTVAAIEADHGPIDLAVLNAGNHRPTPASDLRPADFRDLFAVNVFGVVNGLAALLPLMRARGRGRIAIVASVAGYSGLPGASAYGATKAALINMAEALRVELAGSGVDIRLVSPGFVRTPLTDRNDFPMPFRIEAEDAARRMVRALTRTNAFESHFPRRFTLMLKLLRLLPYRLYFPLVGRMTGQGR